MKRRQEVDDIFKQKLEQHTVPPPPDMWNRIVQARQARPQQILPVWALIAVRNAAVLALFIVAILVVDQLADSTPKELGSFYVSPVAPQAIDNLPPASASMEVEPAIAPLPAVIATIADRTRPVAVTEAAGAIMPIAAIEENTALINTQQDVSAASDKPVTAATEPDVQQHAIYSKTWAPMAQLPTLSLTSPPMPLPQYIKCARFGGSTWRFHLEALAAPELPMRELRPREAEAQSYARLRQQTEKPDFAFSAALRLALVSEDGFVLKTGLHYSQVNENFSFFNPNEQRIIITDIYGSDGHLIRTDTTVVNGAEYKADNRYQWLDVPVLAGYEIDFGKVTFALNAGAHINLLLSANGQFLSPEDLQGPVNFEEGGNPPGQVFRPRIGVGWYASMGILYNVKPGWQLLFEPGFRIYPRSLTRSHFEVDQRYFISGINVGIRRAL